MNTVSSLSDRCGVELDDAAIVAVGHTQFKTMGAAAIRQLCRRNHVLYDIKYAFPADQVDGRI